MDIYSLSQLPYNSITNTFNIYNPQFVSTSNNSLLLYVVQFGEDMRIDLVMLSMYDNDKSVLESIDVILFINGIDNPLNIMEGDTLYYPPQEALDSYRYYTNENIGNAKNVRNTLAVPNKTTKVDSSRKKFVDNGYSLPPVVLDEAKQPVRIEGDKIVIGGLN